MAIEVSESHLAQANDEISRLLGTKRIPLPRVSVVVTRWAMQRLQVGVYSPFAASQEIGISSLDANLSGQKLPALMRQLRITLQRATLIALQERRNSLTHSRLYV